MLTYLVHDAVTAAGTPLLSFNAQQLRMIAASRKRPIGATPTGSPRRCRRGCIRIGLRADGGDSRAASAAEPAAGPPRRLQPLAVPGARVPPGGGLSAAPGVTALRAALTPGNAGYAARHRV